MTDLKNPERRIAIKTLAALATFLIYPPVAQSALEILDVQNIKPSEQAIIKNKTFYFDKPLVFNNMFVTFENCKLIFTEKLDKDEVPIVVIGGSHVDMRDCEITLLNKEMTYFRIGFDVHE